MSLKVLVVDDSLMIRKKVGSTLSAAGFAILEAADGIEALQRLWSNRDTRLVVCDVNMPRLNGLELLGHLSRAMPAMPVVMLSTESLPALMQRARELGAKGWIAKPFKPDVLVATARKLTEVAA